MKKSKLLSCSILAYISLFSVISTTVFGVQSVSSTKVSNGFTSLIPVPESAAAVYFWPYHNFSIRNVQNFFKFSKQYDFNNSFSSELSYSLATGRALSGGSLSKEDLFGLNLSLDYSFDSNYSDFRKYVGIDAGVNPAIHIGGEYYIDNKSYIKADLRFSTLLFFPDPITELLLSNMIIPTASISYGVKF